MEMRPGGHSSVAHRTNFLSLCHYVALFYVHIIEMCVFGSKPVGMPNYNVVAEAHRLVLSFNYFSVGGCNQVYTAPIGNIDSLVQVPLLGKRMHFWSEVVSDPTNSTGYWPISR